MYLKRLFLLLILFLISFTVIYIYLIWPKNNSISKIAEIENHRSFELLYPGGNFFQVKYNNVTTIINDRMRLDTLPISLKRFMIDTLMELDAGDLILIRTLRNKISDYMLLKKKSFPNEIKKLFSSSVYLSSNFNNKDLITLFPFYNDRSEKISLKIGEKQIQINGSNTILSYNIKEDSLKFLRIKNISDVSEDYYIKDKDNVIGYSTSENKIIIKEYKVVEFNKLKLLKHYYCSIHPFENFKDNVYMSAFPGNMDHFFSTFDGYKGIYKLYKVDTSSHKITKIYEGEDLIYAMNGGNYFLSANEKKQTIKIVKTLDNEWKQEINE